MKTKLFILFLFLVSEIVSSCKNKVETIDLTETMIINDNFLTIVDTLAYKYQTLRPVAESDSMHPQKDSLIIAVYNRLDNILVWEKNIKAKLLNLNSKVYDKGVYLKLLNENVKDTTQMKLSITKIEKSGKYKLIEYSDKNLMRINGTIGHVKFSRVLYNDKMDIALLVCTIADNIKNGVVKLFLLEHRQTDKWKVVDQLVLEVW